MKFSPFGSGANTNQLQRQQMMAQQMMQMGGNRSASPIARALTSFMGAKGMKDIGTAETNQRNQLAQLLAGNDPQKQEMFQNFDPQQLQQFALQQNAPITPYQQQQMELQKAQMQQQHQLMKQRMSNSHPGGGTGYIIDQLRKEDPKLTYEQAVSQYLYGARKGMEINDQGSIVPVRGVPESLGQINYGETAGGERAKLEYEPKITREKELSKAEAEKEISLRSAEASLPRLYDVVDRLSELGKTATYTTIGRARDTAVRELGLQPTKGAVDRTEYIATVDNEVLPLLRETFGNAFTQKEGESLKVTLGDPNKTPQEKDAVLRAFIATKQKNIGSQRREVGRYDQPAQQPQSTGYKSKYGLE